MEIIYLGLILFIIGVGATIVYDKAKEQKQKNAADMAAARTLHTKMQEANITSVSSPRVSAAKAGATKITRTTNTYQLPDSKLKDTMTVQELIDYIENLKKDL